MWQHPRLKQRTMSPLREKDNEPVASTEMESQEGPAQNLERDQKIRSRVYERYLERGQEAGHDLEDWLQAELTIPRSASSAA